MPVSTMPFEKILHIRRGTDDQPGLPGEVPAGEFLRLPLRRPGLFFFRRWAAHVSPRRLFWRQRSLRKNAWHLDDKADDALIRFCKDDAVADEKYSCHILKPLESIDIPGLAGVLRHFLPLILLAYPGIK